MRCTKPEYSKIDATVAGIPAAEPVFLLRAQDEHAQAAVRFYADRVQAAGGDPNVVSSARASVSAFAAWPVKKAPTFEAEFADDLAATAAQLIADGVKVGDVIELPAGRNVRVLKLDESEVVVEEIEAESVAEKTVETPNDGVDGATPARRSRRSA